MEKNSTANIWQRQNKMGADVEYPVSHVAYGYATQLCILKEDGTIEKMVGAMMWEKL